MAQQFAAKGYSLFYWDNEDADVDFVLQKENKNNDQLDRRLPALQLERRYPRPPDFIFSFFRKTAGMLV